MDKEKRLFLFLILALAILFIFSQLYSPHQLKKSQEIPEVSQAQPQREEKAPPQKTALFKQVKTETFETEDFLITYCPTGGYIKKLYIKKYAEVLLYQDFLVLPQYLDKEFRVEKTPQSLKLIYEEGALQVIKEFKFIKPYLWEIVIKSSRPVLSQLILFSQTTEEKSFYKRYEEVFYKKEQLKRIYSSRLKKAHFLSNPLLLGARDRYYSVALLDPPQGDYALRKEAKNILFTWKTKNPVSSFKTQFFLGPQEMKILKDYGIQEIINFGFFNGIGILILNILYFFFSIFKNWGVSIIILSTLIYLILFPLTAKSTQSMKKMQELQPQMEELRKRFKDNPQKLNKETLELYKKYRVNPLGGCLPMLLQIPIFFALYQVLIRSVEIKGAKFLWIKDLSKQDYLLKFPFSLPIIGNGLHILPIIMTVLMILQQKLTTPKIQSSEQQKFMGMIMPLIFGIIFYNFPSGLVLYWLCNSLFTFLYQLKLVKMKAI